MATVTGSISIDRAPESVFDVLAAEELEPRYNPSMLSVEKLTEGPPGVGSRFRARHAPRRRPSEMVIEFTEFDRPRRLASSTTMPWGDVTGALDLVATGTGTRLEWTWVVRPRGFAKVMSPVVGLIGARAERACWEGLKRYLESGT
ncbi:MAG: SRPBCC family protein [Acidobacteriota bacterium]|nr:SRPBCC family protein [Acidobacteriota bacterium]